MFVHQRHQVYGKGRLWKEKVSKGRYKEVVQLRKTWSILGRNKKNVLLEEKLNKSKEENHENTKETESGTIPSILQVFVMLLYVTNAIVLATKPVTIEV